MINSNYIKDILDLLLDCDEDGLLAKQQIPFLMENDFNYTGAGVFVYFEHSTGVEKFRIETPNLLLNGVTITSEKHQIEASANLFFKEGIIDYLEIWCHIGDYPKSDLTNYVLTQTWLSSKNKAIIKK